MSSSPLSKQVLELDCEQEIEKICSALQEYNRKYRRRGAVIAMSGGIDSSVCAALSVKAFGPKRVQALLLPEQDSSQSSSSLGGMLAKHLGLEYIATDLSPTLEAIGCYQWRDEAIRTVFPDYRQEWKSKIAISGGAKGGFHYFRLIVQTPDGELLEKRLPHKAYLQIVAATNFKQRIRKTIEYFHADRLNYSVIGTPNRVEYDQGFFVKNGDGSADIKPIAHLYKTQIYALARYMNLPEAICTTTPTTDTYSLPQGQDEFYYALPYDKMDLALWAHNHGVAAAELARVLDIGEEQAELVYADIDAKRSTTRYMHAKPNLVESVTEIQPDS
ncbi:MAG TPA: NAD(+) synthase [Gammaproteobacteria bacterium]|nr:NAD(+) synthase [Gammaproteobacteria bacterium]